MFKKIINNLNGFMIKKVVCKIVFTVFLLGFSNIYSQDEINKIVVPDSLLEKSYDELRNLYDKSFKSGREDHSLIYAKTRLLKAKKEKDTLMICKGYHLLSLHFYNEISLKYNDSIIQICKGKNYKQYPIIAYILNGKLFYKEKKFEESFDSFLQAKPYVDKCNEPEYYSYYINHMIGGIKSKLLLNKEALKIFKESWKFVKENDYRTKEKRDYILALTDLSISYVQNNMLDSATVLNKIGIKESLALEYYGCYNFLVLNEGINLHLQDKNLSAIDSLKKVITYFEKEENYSPLLYGYYYIGNSYVEQNNIENGLKYFKKIDSIFEKINYIDPQVRGSYESLIDYYKSTNDKESTLIYIEKLIKVDSVLNSNFRDLSPRIIKEYDTPKLLKEKDDLINSVSKKNKNYINIGVLMIGFIISIVIALIYNIQKQRKLKVRFNKLLEKSENRIPNNIEKKPDLKILNKSVNFNVSDEVLQKIKIEVDEFEKNHGYLEHGITINSVAKKMETNSKYLSLFINNYKDQTFTSYVNKLRIEYAIKKLKRDATFRKFTVKAIANEVGFNSAESFSTAFYKETQLKPSYFLKNIENLGNGE